MRINKCCLILILIITGIFLIPLLEDDPEVKHRRYKALGFTSAKKPSNTRLLIETDSSGTLYTVDSGDPSELFKSTDKGENWSQPNGNFSLGGNLTAFWHDRANSKLYFCTKANNEVAYVDLTDDTITSLGTPSDNPPFTVSEEMTDVFIVGSDIWSVIFGDTGVVTGLAFLKWVDPNWVFQARSLLPGRYVTANSPVIVDGTDVYLIRWVTTTELSAVIKIDTTIVSLTTLDTIANTKGPSSVSQYSIAYDGLDKIHFISENTGDNFDYLHSYSFTADAITQLGKFDIAFMQDRDNEGIAPNELEKAFGVSGVNDEIVYELKPRRGGIIQLQDVNAISDASLIAITDNFLMNSDGDMFEWTDVTDEMFKLSYLGGIFPLIKKGSFLTLRYYETNWNEEDSIKVYDDNDVLEIWAKITKKYVDTLGQTHFDFDFYSNELARTTYNKTYSNNKTSEKLIDIIDNGMNFLYQSSSIVTTTIQYDYEFMREAMFMFTTARWLENEILYAEPDGKTWSKAYDGLAKNPLIYPGTYNFKEEADGTSGTDIDFVDLATVGANTTVQIIASLDGHRKVLELFDNDGGALIQVINNFSAQIDGTVEFWIRTTDSTKRCDFDLFIGSGGGVGAATDIFLRGGELQHFDGGFNTIATILNNTWYHIKYVFDCVTDTLDVYVDGVLKEDDLPFVNNATTLQSFILRTNSIDSNYYTYIDAIGYSWDPNYNIGDNEVAWSLYNGHQDVRLVNIPNMSLDVGAYFNGSLGATRATTRYKNNATTTKPDAPESVEQATGIIEVTEYRDARLEGATEADQLTTNRYTIGSSNIQFIGLRVQGEGFLQEGKTVHLENTQSITITENDFTILRYKRFPKQDITIMVLSDNIIFPQEFTTFLDTTRTQIHAANLQSIENQFDINLHLTREGGIGLKLTNKTGVASVKGTIVEPHAGVDNAFRVCDADSNESFGIVYEDGIADGDECLIITGGRCQVLLKDATASTRNFWVKVSDVAGRADATNASPAAAPTHFLEIGHCIESKGADTDVLAYIITHRN